MPNGLPQKYFGKQAKKRPRLRHRAKKGAGTILSQWDDSAERKKLAKAIDRMVERAAQRVQNHKLRRRYPPVVV